MPAAFAETATANLVTREYLDLRLSKLEARLRGEIAAVRAEAAVAKAELRQWIIGANGCQTVVILGAVAVLIRLLH